MFIIVFVHTLHCTAPRYLYEICIFVHVRYMNIYIYIHLCVCACTCVHMYVYIYTYKGVYMYRSLFALDNWDVRPSSVPSIAAIFCSGSGGPDRFW